QLHDSLTRKATTKTFAFDFKANGNSSFAKLDRTGRLLICVSNSPDKTSSLVQIWDVEKGKLEGPALVITKRIAAWAVTQTGSQICLLYEENAEIWDIIRGIPLSKPLANPNKAANAFFSRDGSRVAVYGENWLTVWDLATYRTAFPTLSTSTNTISYSEFS